MAINSFLASPSFQAWMEGEAMDPAQLLWDPSGKPRHSIFYLAHLSDRERMFFVTLFLSAVEGWMRAQSGSPSLRAMIYFDEVLGFLPPVKEPPSKGPLIRLLKQARAFGLGLLLTTQNPVDLDYKALSNAGTWFIGRLQTEQDKARLLDGLESAASGEGGFKRSQADLAISSLKKRVFLLQNVHEPEPAVFHTRWAMAYLKGPITRTQLKDLNALAGAVVSKSITPAQREIASQPVAEREALMMDGSATRPSVVSGVGEYFLPNNLTVARALKDASRDPASVSTLGQIYRPVLLAQATARILDRKADLDVDHSMSALVPDPDRRGVVRWENYLHSSIRSEETDDIPLPDSRYANLDAPLNELKTLRQMEKDFVDYFYRNAEVKVPSNPGLKLVAQPGTTKAEFRAQCADAARESRDDEIEEVRQKYVAKMKAVQKRLAREQRELDEDQAEHSARKMEEMATHLENVIGIFGGSKSRRRVSTSMTKRRMTSKAKADIEESQDAIDTFKQELEDLEFEMNDAVEEIEDRWAEVAGEIEEVVFRAYKKDIHVEMFGVAWFPYWQVKEGEEVLELPGYQA
jgi:transcription antitermination factor NusG